MSADSKIPDLYAEQDAMGELPMDCDREIRTKLESEPQRSVRLKDLMESNEQILTTYPAEQMALEIRNRHARSSASPRPHRAMRLALAGIPAVIVLALATWLVWPMIFEADKPSGIQPPPEGIRYKGETRLIMHRKLPAGYEELQTGNSAGEGDELLISYLAEHTRYGVIVSIDGRGQATLHYPEQASGSTALQQGKPVSLPFAYKLDDAPDFERFFLVTADSPLDVEQVLGAVKKLGADPKKALDLPSGMKHKEFLLNK